MLARRYAYVGVTYLAIGTYSFPGWCATISVPQFLAHIRHAFSDPITSRLQVPLERRSVLLAFCVPNTLTVHDVCSGRRSSLSSRLLALWGLASIFLQAWKRKSLIGRLCFVVVCVRRKLSLAAHRCESAGDFSKLAWRRA